MFCATCACELPAIARFCVRCGSRVESPQNATHTQPLRTEIREAPEVSCTTCSKCGFENPRDYSFCIKCGEQLKTLGYPVFVSSTAIGSSISVSPVTREPAVEVVAAPIATASIANPTTTTKEFTAPTVGVGGWLLLFCIGATVISPLVIGAELIQNLNDTFVVLVDISVAALSIYTGIAVWRVRPDAFRMLKIYFVVIAVLAALSIAGSFVSKSDPSKGAPDDFMAVGLRSLVAVIIWGLYFHKSRRVKDTFGTNL
jgi:hypothetical protein